MWNFSVSLQVTSQSSLPPIVFKKSINEQPFHVCYGALLPPFSQNQILRGTGRELEVGTCVHFLALILSEMGLL